MISIIHRQEQIGLLGVPLVRFIDIDDRSRCYGDPADP